MFRRTRKGLVEMIYDVEIKPDEGYWFIKVPSINRVTQAKNLKEVDGFVACKPGILMPGLHAMRVFC